MTNEQAAIKLQNILNDDHYAWHPAHAEALRMAVEALKGGDGDCISRAEAIDIANDLRDCISVDGYWAWTERLMSLPSAQPEIIRCKDCKYYRQCDDQDDLCVYTMTSVEANDYCSYAERREDAERRTDE